MPPKPVTVHFQVDELNDGKRLDVVISAFVSGCSRNRAAELARQGTIRLNGETKKPSSRVHEGDVIDGVLPEPEPTEYLPESIPLDILYEDTSLLVINKPAGMVVHPAAGHTEGTLVNALIYHCKDLQGIGGELRPGIVHRLDKDTSGTIVVAKSEDALNHLAAQFKSRQIKKTYLAMVYRVPESIEGKINLPIGRHTLDRKKMSVTAKRSRPAETHWRVQERFSRSALLQVDLKTGRTHQIRVHCAAVGHPIMGDHVYGWQKLNKAAAATGVSYDVIRSIQRQMLHAWRLSFDHPDTGKRMVFESPLPEDMLGLIDRLRGKV